MYNKNKKYVAELTNRRLLMHIERFITIGERTSSPSPSEFGELYVKAKLSAKQLRLNASNGDCITLNSKTTEIVTFLDQKITGSFSAVKSSEVPKLREVLHELMDVVNN